MTPPVVFTPEERGAVAAALGCVYVAPGPVPLPNAGTGYCIEAEHHGGDPCGTVEAALNALAPYVAARQVVAARMASERARTLLTTAAGILAKQADVLANLVMDTPEDQELNDKVVQSFREAAAAMEEAAGE